MRSGQTSNANAVFHLEYASVVARRRIVVEHLRRPLLFFVDVPIPSASGARQILEVGLGGGLRQSDSVISGIERMRSKGLVTEVYRRAEALVLHKSLFPLGVVPDFYVDALCVSSYRAAEIMAAIADSDCSVSDSTLTEELLTLYKNCMPDDESRRRSIAWHIDWLESVGEATVGRQSIAERMPRDASVTFCDLEVASYQGCGHALALYASKLGADLKMGRDALANIRELAQAAIIARLAHTQVVRLLGPRGSVISREVALLKRCFGG